MPIIALVLGLVGVVIGVIGAYVLQQVIRRNRVESAERTAARILNEADRRQKELLLEAKDEACEPALIVFRRTRPQQARIGVDSCSIELRFRALIVPPIIALASAATLAASARPRVPYLGRRATPPHRGCNNV